MKVEVVPIGRVIPYARNPRKNDGAVGKVAASIQEFGFRQPIVVDEAGVIIAGHTRLLAAQRLGLVEVPVHVATGLSPAQAKAYRIMDNRSSQEAEWDSILLPLEFADLKEMKFDLELTGFEEGEIAALFRGGTEGLTDPDEVPEAPADPVTRPGDLIVLGNHRLLCGDATVAADVDRLMGGNKAACMWTDPPYGVNYTGKTKDALTIENDGADGLSSLLYATFKCVGSVLEPGSPFYIAHPAGALCLTFGSAILAAGWKFHQTLIWIKDSMVLGHSDYHFKHEPIYYGWTKGVGRSGRGNHDGTRWHGDHSQVSVFEVPRPKASPDHPTGKPVGLVVPMLTNSTTPGEIVIDPFLGSGTTIIAAEMTGRSCYGLEIDPKYCDVIVQRWENFTGKKAEREDGKSARIHEGEEEGVSAGAGK